LPLDREFCSESEIKDLPGAAIFAKVDAALGGLSDDLETAVDTIEARLDVASRAIDQCDVEWSVRKDAVEAEFAKVLRELQQDKIDGQEFVRIRKQIEQLKPASDRKRSLSGDLTRLKKERRTLVAQWADGQGDEFRRLARVAEAVSGRLHGRVRVRVDVGRDLGPLLKSQIRGRLAESLEAFTPDLSMLDLASAIQKGAVELQKKFAIPAAQAALLTGAGPELPMLVQELELPVTTQLELNVDPRGNRSPGKGFRIFRRARRPPRSFCCFCLSRTRRWWSTSPRTTWTTDSSPKVSYRGCWKRSGAGNFCSQLTTPTSPSWVTLSSSSVSGRSGMQMLDTRRFLWRTGDQSTPDVRDLVEEVLEGGKEAFQTRRLKYGF